MFLNKAKFKKQVKKAYKSTGIHIMLTNDNVYVFEAGWWFMEVPKSNLTKEIMAAVIEIVGTLPEKGEGILYRKDEAPQEEMVETYMESLAEQLDQAKEQYTSTNVMFRTQKTCVEVLQNTKANNHLLIPQQFMEMIDSSKTEEGECMLSEYGMTSPDLKNIIYASDCMFLAFRKRPCRYLGEKEFMDSLAGVDLTWSWNEDEMISLL